MSPSVSLSLGLDVVALLKPIAGPSRCGESLQYDPAYEDIRLARQSERTDLPQGVWERRTPRRVDWAVLQGKCHGVLTERAKDLQIAAWLIEALVHQHRLEGLARGFAIFVELAHVFWSDIHPRLEDQDCDLRLRPVDWLQRAILRWHHAGLLVAQESPDGNAQADDDARLAAWRLIRADLQRLEVLLDTELGPQAQGFGELRAVVMLQCGTLLSPSTPAPPTERSDVETLPPPGRQPVRTREDAYARLREIAELLARIEPHSPVPSVLRGVLAWQDAGFEELLERLPADGPSVYELARLFKAPTK